MADFPAKFRPRQINSSGGHCRSGGERLQTPLPCPYIPPTLDTRSSRAQETFPSIATAIDRPLAGRNRSAIWRSLTRPQMMKTTVVHQLLQVCSPSPSESEEEAPPLKAVRLPLCETKREAKWEKRRRQILQRRRRAAEGEEEAANEPEGKEVEGSNRLTDEDLDELRGSIDLGFGFNEEAGGHDLCDTLPALNLYFAVNRQLSDPNLLLSPRAASTPTAASSLSIMSPRSPFEQAQSAGSSSSDSWKICNPGDSPQFVKTRLRHWAQAVACSLRQSC